MNWFKQLAQRMVWASRAFVADSANPVLQLDNGVTFDFAKNRIILEGNLELEVTGNLSLITRGELVLNSGSGQINCSNNHITALGVNQSNELTDISTTDLAS